MTTARADGVNLASFWNLRLRWMPLSRCTVALAQVAFLVWRHKSWEGEDRRDGDVLKSATNRRIHAASRSHSSVSDMHDAARPGLAAAAQVLEANARRNQLPRERRVTGWIAVSFLRKARVICKSQMPQNKRGRVGPRVLHSRAVEPDSCRARVRAQ